MTKEAEPFHAVREAARAKGWKRFTGHMCKHCGGTRRFVHCNSCVECKKTADRERYYRLTDPNHINGLADSGFGECRISESANRLFLSALAKEKAGIKDE